MIGKIVHYVTGDGTHEASIVTGGTDAIVNLRIFHDFDGIGFGEGIEKSDTHESNTWHEIEVDPVVDSKTVTP